MKKIAFITVFISLLLLPFLSSECIAANDILIKAVDGVLQNTVVQHEYRITPSQLKTLLDTNVHPLIIDIRPTKSFTAGHIPGVIHIPLWSLVETLEKNPAILLIDRPIYVICCAKDIYSAYAVAVLRLGGYNAYAIPGGMPQWAELGYPYVEGTAEELNDNQQPMQMHTPNIEIMKQVDPFIQGIPQYNSYLLHFQELKEKQQNQEIFSLVDVRSNDNDQGKLLPGTYQIPLPRLVEFIHKNPSLIPYDKPVIVVDKLDTQAAFAVFTLRIMGYQAYMILSEELEIEHTVHQ